MKLELKHLAPYLPYGLKIKTNNIVREMVCEIPVMSNYENKQTCITNVINGIGHKPILRSLSDLTKEIEFNGEKFVPINELKCINEKICFSDNRFMDYDDGKNVDIIHFSFYDIFSYSLDMSEVFEIQEKLFEWHFDVFGLIEKGLAIDINTLQDGE